MAAVSWLTLAYGLLFIGFLREPRFSTLRRVDDRLLQALGEPNTPVWLVVEDDSRRKHSPAFWIFEATLSAAARTLDNHHLLEFYIVSRHFEWLLAENHHDVTIAVGEHAVEALRTIAATTSTDESERR